MKKPWRIRSILLPKDAREELIAAAEVTPRANRARAIEDATERARQKYPQFFRQEQHHENQT